MRSRAWIWYAMVCLVLCVIAMNAHVVELEKTVKELEKQIVRSAWRQADMASLTPSEPTPPVCYNHHVNPTLLYVTNGSSQVVTCESHFTAQ